MINVTALNSLLTDNADGKIFRRWSYVSIPPLDLTRVLTITSITTPGGSLLAYTTPTDIRELRDQTALVLATWREQSDAIFALAEDTENEAAAKLRTLTIEFDNRNILVRELQPKLLLVLEGGVPPGRTRKLHITAESADGTRHSVDHGQNGDATPHIGSPTAQSEASTTFSSRKRRMSILDIHRRKLDALAEVIQQDFGQAHFVMPTNLDDRLY